VVRKWSAWRPSISQASLGESDGRLLALPLTHLSPAPMAGQVFYQAAAAVGEVLTLGD